MSPPPHRPLSMPHPEDYFRGVSPLCRRILEDMARVRENFGEKWNDLSYEEQCKILDQTIVDEATVRRYETADLVGPDCEYFPKLKISTGQKIVSDEKLSARGYTCSWRDEHSAPFSWHTRSQMDLTLDTPPATPTQTMNPSTHINENDDDEESDESPKQDGMWSSTPIMPHVKTAPFLWHYEPQLDLKPPDPPDLVLASLNTNDKTNGSNLVPKGTQFNHMVVRAQEERYSGFFGWFRGALSAITGTCIPIHSCSDNQKGGLHPGSPYIHPELRPPHVIAKGSKISAPMAAQPKRKTESQETIFKIPKDATLKSECPSTETTFTNDILSDKGSQATFELENSSKRDSQNLNRNLLSNRNSLMYGTFTEESVDGHQTDENRESNQNFPNSLLIVNDPTKSLLSTPDSSAKDGYCPRDAENNERTSSTPPSPLWKSPTFDSDENFPLINLSTNNEATIPKTGFDFLDNW